MAQLLACHLDELAPGTVKRLVLGARAIAIVRCNDDVYALQDSCPHKGAPLSDGAVSVQRCELICPWHRFRFHLATGRSVTNPSVAVRTFSVHIDDGKVLVDLSRAKSESDAAPVQRS